MSQLTPKNHMPLCCAFFVPVRRWSTFPAQSSVTQHARDYALKRRKRRAFDTSRRQFIKAGVQGPWVQLPPVKTMGGNIPYCYWVRSLDFNFSGNQGGFPIKPTKSDWLFAEGSLKQPSRMVQLPPLKPGGDKYNHHCFLRIVVLQIGSLGP